MRLGKKPDPAIATCSFWETRFRTQSQPRRGRRGGKALCLARITPKEAAGLSLAQGQDSRQEVVTTELTNGDYSITTSLHNDGRHYPASKHIKQTTAELKPEVGGPQTQLEVAQCPGDRAGRVPGKHEGLENPPDHCDLSRARERATAHTPQPRCHPTFVAGPGLGQTRVPTGSCYWRPAAYLPDAKLTTE